MIEDTSLNEFIRTKLEEDVGSVPAVDFSRLATAPSPAAAERCLRRPALGIRCLSTARPYLVAASLIAVCGLFAVHFRRSSEECRERAAINAIELLEGGSSAIADSTPYAERLVAWQDAPYAEISE